MRLIKCDRCGAAISTEENDNAGYVSLQWRSLANAYDVDGNNPFDNWDFCPDCMKAIEEFVKKQPKEEKFEKILDSVDAGKKAQKEKKKYVPKFDVGKAQALRDRGWSIVKIAEEMKVSEPTIIKWTHPALEPKKPKPLEWAEHEPDLNPVLKGTMESKQHAVLDIVQEEP